MDLYRPLAIRRQFIPSSGSREIRPLGIPTIQDRVVQTALRMVLEPIQERDFALQSYGFRPGVADPPVRFGGRGESRQLALATPIAAAPCCLG
jgi:hypothetical protein